MKPITPHVPAVPASFWPSDLSEMRTSDAGSLGMAIRKPRDYSNALRHLPTGRALRRLLEKNSKREKAAFGEAAISKNKGKART